MKRKLLALMLATTIVGAGLLTGCKSREEAAPSSSNNAPTTNETAQSGLKDGKFKAEASDFDDKGWKPFVEVEVKEGKITAVTFDYTNKDGKFKSEDANYNKNMEAKVKTGPAKYTKELEDALVAKQDITKVDTVAGATHSVENFKVLGAKALENAKAGDTTVAKVVFEAAAAALKDGKYKAEAADFDDKGWKPFVEVEVKGGKIAAVAFDYTNKDGKFKSEDADYNKNMEAKVKTGPAKYTKELEDALVAKQDITKVDTVAGATHSVENFKALGTKAIENAGKGDTAVAKVTMK
jgi:major membrane immunogen (membrane-anchored lipoprotein)